LRLTAVCMLRNEADILPAFLGHCSVLFDEVLVADHASCDGSTEILAAASRLMPLRVWRFGYRGQLQHQVLSALAEHAFAHGADWVFPLDADEFPRVASRAAFEAALSDAPAGHWQWRNLWPIGPTAFQHLDAAHRYDSMLADTIKIASSRRLPPRQRAGFGQGSHGIRGTDLPTRHRIGELLHIPLRHPARVALKAMLGARANRARPDWKLGEAWQWDMLGEVPEAGLRDRALGYPHAIDPATATEPLDWAPLGVLAGLPVGEPDPARVLERDAATLWQRLPAASLVKARLEGDAVLVVPERSLARRLLSALRLG
jgi:hypothetical protein